MSKIITFSQRFQKDHPRAGKPTYFVEQILNHFGINLNTINDLQEYTAMLFKLNKSKIEAGKITESDIEYFISKLNWEIDRFKIKIHTIRGGARFKTGEYFKPCVWTGKPYNSSQIIFWDDIYIEKTIPITMRKWGEGITKYCIYDFRVKKGRDMLKSEVVNELLPEIAKNDGLELSDFKAWFESKDVFFGGQIIAWKDPKYFDIPENIILSDN